LFEVGQANSKGRGMSQIFGVESYYRD